VLETASVAGVEFSTAVVAAPLERPVTEIEACCSRLSRHEQFVHACGVGQWPDGTVSTSFRFHHALYADVLYGRLAPGHRVELHRRIAERQEEGYGERAVEIAAELAHHFRNANDSSKAIRYFRVAGEQAVRRSANREAVAHFRAALQILGESPPVTESGGRANEELTLQLMLVTPLRALKGFASIEVEIVLSRARALCQQIGEVPELFPVMWGLWVFYTARAEHAVALELAEGCLRLAESTPDDPQVLEAHHALGVSRFARGEVSKGREHLERAVAQYEPKRHAILALRYGQDAGVVCLSHAAEAAWLLGEPTKATKMAEEAVSLARQLSQPFTLATVSVVCAWVSQFSGEEATTRERAETAVAFAKDKEFAFWGAMGVVMRGWAVAEQGCLKEGLGEMQAGLAKLEADGARIMRPYVLGLLAECLAKVGQAKEAVALLNEAQRAAEESGEHFWDAELYRLRGELTLRLYKNRGDQRKDPLGAEACFERALAVARSQQAKSLQLRVAMSWSRLRQLRGKTEEARSGLAAVYDRFTEGFETRDLREAKALLDEWS
jgi:predicted ATPase